MPKYRYVKHYPKGTAIPHRTLSVLLFSTGSSLLLWTLWPIISFVVFLSGDLSPVVSPIPNALSRVSGGQWTDVAQNGFHTASVTLTGTDFTNPNVWFPDSPQTRLDREIQQYSLDIPQLGIQNAMTVVGGGDLNTSLIHYGGTSLPGKYGNAVIFGHSTLPQLYNPSNYTTIFSKLPELRSGDTFTIHVDGVSYLYEIFSITVTQPTDLSPLEQRYDDSYVTLVTCVPPGTYAKRMNVKAKLIKI